jgi:phytoene synthase
VDGTAPRPSLDESIRHCCAVTRQSKSQFYLTFFALPRSLFRDMCVLYAFMRRTDDLADEPGVSLDDKRIAIHRWRNDLDAAIQGHTIHDRVLPAVADIIRRHEIPPQYLRDVIAGVESDLEPRVIDDFAQLQSYCYHVAGAVGLCCIRIWKYSDPQAEQAAIACGTAFQLTNILRDLKEDSLAGRCYLPLEDLRRFGVTPDELRHGGDALGYQQLMQFEVDRARQFYADAQPLLKWLSPEGRRVQKAMFRTYGGLLDEIERRKFDVQSSRVRLPRWIKWTTGVRCLVGC